MMRISRLLRLAALASALGLLVAPVARGAELTVATDVELQPLAAHVDRVSQALEWLGEPLSGSARARLRQARAMGDPAAAVRAIQEALDPACLFGMRIDPERRISVVRGPAPARLVQHGFRVVLVKVLNEAGATGRLVVDSPNAQPMTRKSSFRPEPDPPWPASDLRLRWMHLKPFEASPMKGPLSGLGVEYRLLQVYSRDAGPEQARFRVGLGTPPAGTDPAPGGIMAGPTGELDLAFVAAPAVTVTLEVRDHDGRPTTGSFLFRDPQGRVYPAPSRRLAPDFPFQRQVYRSDGETVLLPPGSFEVEYGRGPEYLVERRTIAVPDAPSHHEAFRLKRWVHPAALGWYSGDHHIHAAGCGHYESPTEGVGPEDMMRHILGEDLDVGCVLSWGPCWYAQKAFFGDKVHPLSTTDHLMRYDVEVSGFPSSHCGHLCLLRLNEDDYPGTTRVEQWPSWDLPVLKWARAQGAVVGFAHSGYGLRTRDNALPSYDVPPFGGIGANEYIVDVAHDAVDFLSVVDTPAPWELNLWYHALNCGFRTRIAGETDFPCIWGERVGVGRTYVKLPVGALGFDAWVDGLKAGRSYVGEGKSHLLDFRVEGLAVGESGSELRLAAPGEVKVSARVAAYLEPDLTPALEAFRRSRSTDRTSWSLERARIGTTRRVPVEVVVNGRPVARTEVEADGTLREIALRVPIARSSWVALRVYPSSHTNPVFVLVDGAPVRASRRSAEWCLKCVDQCWSKKARAIRPEELESARAAYDVARAAYRKIRAESAAD